MDKIRQNLYLETETHAALKIAALKQGRSAQNLGAFIIAEWVRAQRQANLMAVCVLAREQLRGLDAPGENGREMAIRTLDTAIEQHKAAQE